MTEKDNNTNAETSQNDNSRTNSPKSHFLRITIIIIVSVLFGVVLGTWMIFEHVDSFVDLIQKNAFTTASTDMISIQNEVETVAENSLPAVVKINANCVNNGERIMGSGVVIKSDGVILTNAHVVSGTENIIVTLDSGKTYSGKIIGADDSRDIALVKINAKDLPYIQFADASTIKVGEFVVAIGHPFGLDAVTTFGIVSTQERNIDIGGEVDLEGVIQTDAAINPGNSGGPLLDLSGKIVGVNTMIYEGAQGFSFSVSCDVVQKVLGAIYNPTIKEVPFIGVTSSDATVRGSIPGAYVEDIMSHGPADKAGIEVKDIITAVNKQRVTDKSSLETVLSKCPIGSFANFTVSRNGKILNIPVYVGNRFIL